MPYGNAKKNADGSFTCQHGAGECEADAQELCVQYHLTGDLTQMWAQSLNAWPFFLCMEEAEGNPAKGQSCYNSSMNTTALPWSTISDCVANEFNIVTEEARKATPTHDCK